jgi:hypothetical protein
MRAIDAKTLEKLEMLYGDKDCFASLQDWFGTTEAYWANLERLFMVADYAKNTIHQQLKKLLFIVNELLNYFAKLSIMRVDGILSTKKNADFPQRITPRPRTKVGTNLTSGQLLKKN